MCTQVTYLQELDQVLTEKKQDKIPSGSSARRQGVKEGSSLFKTCQDFLAYLPNKVLYRAPYTEFNHTLMT